MKKDNTNPERTCFTLSTELMNALEKESVMLDRTVSWIVRKAVQEYFDRRTVGVEGQK